MSKYALYGGPHALYIAYVRSEHEHIRARHGSDDYLLRLVEGIPAARHDRDRSTRACVLQRRLAPNAARCARDEDNFATVGPRGV